MTFIKVWTFARSRADLGYDRGRSGADIGRCRPHRTRFPNANVRETVTPATVMVQ